METTRRAIGLMAAGTLTAASLIDAAPASVITADEVAVAAGVEALREAIFKADRAKLEELAADSLS